MTLDQDADLYGVVPAAVIEIGQAGNAEEAEALAEPALSAAVSGAVAQAIIDFHSQLQQTGALL